MFEMCEWLISRQTYKGSVQWIVVDDGKVPTECTRNQEYFRIERNSHPKVVSARRSTLGRNLAFALPHVKSNKVLIIEDDDYYGRDYLRTYFDLLKSHDLVGEAGAKYYRLDNNTFEHFMGGGYLREAALARTGFTASQIPKVSEQCAGDSHIDSRIWNRLRCSKNLLAPSVSGLHVSIKKGLGRQSSKHNTILSGNDPASNMLLEWTKGDWRAVSRYKNISESLKSPDIKWAVGVTSAPRKPETLKITLDNLVYSGFESPVVFTEPGVSPTSYPTVVRPKILGVWANYIQTIKDLLKRYPKATYLLVAQDDIELCKDARLLVESMKWPVDCGVLSLYSPAEGYPVTGQQYEAVGTAMFRPVTGNLVGALAYVFTRASAERFLETDEAKNWRGRANGKVDRVEYKRAVDACVGEGMLRLGLRAYYPTISICQHISTESTIGYGANVGYRRSNRYPGRHVSALELFNLKK